MFCKRCNRPLKDKKSITLGLGPKCKKKEDAEILEQLQKDGLSGDLIPQGIQIHLIPGVKGGDME